VARHSSRNDHIFAILVATDTRQKPAASGSLPFGVSERGVCIVYGYTAFQTELLAKLIRREFNRIEIQNQQIYRQLCLFNQKVTYLLYGFWGLTESDTPVRKPAAWPPNSRSIACPSRPVLTKLDKGPAVGAQARSSPARMIRGVR
jgi:hypothetical protein